MNANLLSKMKNIFVILFILSLSFPIKAQDTIHCYDSRYYWNNEYCGIIQSIDTNNPEVTVGLTMNSNCCSEYQKPIILKQIIAPENSSELTIYGIAGTTVACDNPMGCYFYICKLVDNELIILDSAQWREPSSKYMHYEYDDRHTLLPIFETGFETFTIADIAYSENPEYPRIYEAYFDNPISLTDTFFIGSNANCRVYYDYYNEGNYDYNGISCPGFIGIDRNVVMNNNEVTYWYMFPFENGEFIGEPPQENYYNSRLFYPILESPTCQTVNRIMINDISPNDVLLNWDWSYNATYYRLEYGEEGFMQGTGILYDSISSTSFNITNLNPNTRYDIYLQKYCEIADTISSWKKVEVYTLDTICSSVENINLQYANAQDATINWNVPSEEVTHYEIEWGESGFVQGSGIYATNINTTSYTFDSLTPTTTYDVYIRSYCPRSELYSEWLSFSFTTSDSISINIVPEIIPITVTPNPTTGIVEVALPQGFENREVQLYDLQGILLQTKVLQTGIATFDLSAYPNGVYIIKVGEASCRVVKNK